MEPVPVTHQFVMQVVGEQTIELAALRLQCAALSAENEKLKAAQEAPKAE